MAALCFFPSATAYRNARFEQSEKSIGAKIFLSVKGDFMALPAMAVVIG
jgi:hypothetical protein